MGAGEAKVEGIKLFPPMTPAERKTGTRHAENVREIRYFLLEVL